MNDKEVDALRVGDKMRFSTELIKYLNQHGDLTQVVMVVKITESRDGLKIVHMARESDNAAEGAQ